jgi:glycosyltransferase involved in cell wall biosynthesis
MVKLLHISSNSFPSMEIEHTTKKIWRELATGFDEYHILARSKDNKFHNFQESNIYLHLVPSFFKSKSFIFTSFHMIKVIKKYDINILLSQCPILGGALATFISKMRKIPIMVEIHGLEYFRILDSNKIKNRIASKLIKYSLNNSTKVRSLSSKMTEMLFQRGFKNNIVEIPNRVNLEIFNKPKKDNNLNRRIKIISVGRFVWEKGYDNAINAVINLRKFYDLELILIGGGPLMNEYIKLIGNNEGIKLIEWIAQEDFVPILHDSDIYIQPSISEGMPRSILEAMAIKLPVVASDVGAISGIIDNMINGVLIQPGITSEIEKAIKLLIENDDLRKRIAKSGYLDVINKYEWKRVFEKYKNELLNMS